MPGYGSHLKAFLNGCLVKRNCFCSHSTSNTKGVGFPCQAILQFSANTNRVFYNLIHSDTNFPELMQTPQVEGSVSQDCLSLQVPIRSSGFQVTHASVRLGYKSGGSHNPLLRSNNLIPLFTEPGKTLYLLLPVNYKRNK